MAVHYFDSIAEMTADPGVAAGDTIIVGGYRYVSDGGGGNFQCHAYPIPAYFVPIDKGLVFDHDTESIWFQRIVDCPYISVKWFGAYGDDIHDDAEAINRAFNACLNHGTAPTICDSGNTKIEIPVSFGVSPTASRTRIFFPSGYYQISQPIAQVTSSYQPYNANCLEIIGEQAGIKTYNVFNVNNVFALYLNPINNVRISGMTFAGFDNAIKFEGNNEAEVVFDNVGFTGINETSVEINCPSANFVFNYVKWYSIIYAIVLKAGNVNVIGGWVTNSDFMRDNDGIFIVEKGRLNMENVMGAPRSGEYRKTCGWIKNLGGSIRCENFRLGGETLLGHIVLNYAKGQVYVDKPKYAPIANPVCLEFLDCICTPNQAVKLFEIPNSIVFENCMQFNFQKPIIGYEGTTPLQEKLDEMYAHFSIKLDNVPYFRGIYNGAGFQANLINATPQYELLPYIKINDGLDSYGYAQDDSCYEPKSQSLKFFMGKVSSDGTIFGGIYGDYSYEVHLTNVSNFDSVPYHPGATGSINEYSVFRIEVQINRSNPYFPKTVVWDIVEITPGGPNTNPDAPVIFRDAVDPNLVLVNNKNNIDASSPPKTKYGIFYEIRNLIPPVAVPFAGSN